MPTNTTLGQLCTSGLDPTGAIKFTIKSSIDYLRPGDLPYPEVFVHQIVVLNDPKSDKFLRVAGIVDLTTLTRGRDAALAMQQSIYLTADFTVQYDDVTTATAAKALIQARVDSLISDWLLYQNQFLEPDSFELPATQSTVVVAAKSGYTAAKKNTVAKNTALTLANDALTNAQAAATAALANVTKAQSRVSTCTQNLALLTAGAQAALTFRSAVTGFEGTLDAFLLQADLFASEAALFQSLHPDATFSTQVSTFAGLLSSFESVYRGAGGFQSSVSAEAANAAGPLAAAQAAFVTECALEQSDVSAAQLAKQAADTAYGQAQTAQTVAQAQADQAAANEAAALAVLVQVCPGVDPATL